MRQMIGDAALAALTVIAAFILGAFTLWVLGEALASAVLARLGI